VASVHINVKIDREMDRALRLRADRAKLPLSTVVRDVLAHGLGIAESPRQAGWRAGRQEAYAAGRKALEEAFSQVPPDPPRG